MPHISETQLKPSIDSNAEVGLALVGRARVFFHKLDLRLVDEFVRHQIAEASLYDVGPGVVRDRSNTAENKKNRNKNKLEIKLKTEQILDSWKAHNKTETALEKAKKDLDALQKGAKKAEENIFIPDSSIIYTAITNAEQLINLAQAENELTNKALHPLRQGDHGYKI